MTVDRFRTAYLPERPTYRSPSEAAEIRMLVATPLGELTHARAAAGHASVPATVEGTTEMFYVIGGRGALWRRVGAQEDVVALGPGRAVVLPVDSAFQYWADEDLELMVATMPMWQHANWHAVDGAWPSGARELAPEVTVSDSVFPLVDLPDHYDYLAPDGSEIRLLTEERACAPTGGLSHCTLPNGAITQPVRHRGVTEIWFTLSGNGQLWRHDEATGDESVVGLAYGVEVEILPGTVFQFRATGADEPLEILILTLPAWPGADEAVSVSVARWPR